MPGFVDLEFLYPMGFAVPVNGVYEIPFIDRMGFVFLISVIGMVIISLYETNRGVKTKGLEIDAGMFKPDPKFTVGSLLVIGIIVALYTIYW